MTTWGTKQAEALAFLLVEARNQALEEAANRVEDYKDWVARDDVAHIAAAIRALKVNP